MEAGILSFKIKFPWIPRRNINVLIIYTQTSNAIQ